MEPKILSAESPSVLAVIAVDVVGGTYPQWIADLPDAHHVSVFELEDRRIVSAYTRDGQHLKTVIYEEKCIFHSKEMI